MTTTTVNAGQLIRLLMAIAGSALGIVVGITPLQGQASAIEVLDGRPLAKILRELENRHGWLITYEDTFHEYGNELEDVTAIARRGTVPPGAPRLLVPRDRRFRFAYENIGSKRPQETLLALIDSYNSNSYSDAFRLLQQGALYHVVPTKSLDANGALVDRQSRLDIRVSLDDREQSAYDMLEAVLKEVSTATGIPIGLGNVPMNLLRSHRVRGGARDENARDVLVRILSATASKMSWQLFCDPGTLKLCAFNLHMVPTTK